MSSGVLGDPVSASPVSARECGVPEHDSVHCTSTQVPVTSASDEGRQRRLVRLVAGLALLAASAVAFLAAAAPTGAPETGTAADACAQVVFAIEREGFRYEFNAVTGVTTLRALGGDLHPNVIAERPQEAARLEKALLEDVGAESLEALREPHRETIESLESLGYL
jgi:hypothetical protein